VLLCVAVCCCVLLCVAVCCCIVNLYEDKLDRFKVKVQVCCSVWKCVAVSCRPKAQVCCCVVPSVAVSRGGCCRPLRGQIKSHSSQREGVLQCVAVCCKLLQGVAVFCCRVLQCSARPLREQIR